MYPRDPRKHLILVTNFRNTLFSSINYYIWSILSNTVKSEWRLNISSYKQINWSEFKIFRTNGNGPQVLNITLQSFTFDYILKIEKKKVKLLFLNTLSKKVGKQCISTSNDIESKRVVELNNVLENKTCMFFCFLIMIIVWNSIIRKEIEYW